MALYKFDFMLCYVMFILSVLCSREGDNLFESY